MKYTSVRSLFFALPEEFEVYPTRIFRWKVKRELDQVVEKLICFQWDLGGTRYLDIDYNYTRNKWSFVFQWDQISFCAHSTFSLAVLHSKLTSFLKWLLSEYLRTDTNYILGINTQSFPFKIRNINFTRLIPILGASAVTHTEIHF